MSCHLGPLGLMMLLISLAFSAQAQSISPVTRPSTSSSSLSSSPASYIMSPVLDSAAAAPADSASQSILSMPLAASVSKPAESSTIPSPSNGVAAAGTVPVPAALSPPPQLSSVPPSSSPSLNSELAAADSPPPVPSSGNTAQPVQAGSSPAASSGSSVQSPPALQAQTSPKPTTTGAAAGTQGSGAGQPSSPDTPSTASASPAADSAPAVATSTANPSAGAVPGNGSASANSAAGGNSQQAGDSAPFLVAPFPAAHADSNASPAAPAPGPTPARRWRRYRPEEILGMISNFTQPKLGSQDLDKLLEAGDAAYQNKIGAYSDTQNATWHQGNPSDNSAYGYYNGTRLPGQYRDSGGNGRKLLASTVPYTAAVQATLLANNTPQTNITVRGVSISDGYKFPRKQGIDDLRYLSKGGTLTATNANNRDDRWDNYPNVVHAGVHKHNVFWSTFESGSTLPSNNTLTCPSGTVMIPESAAIKAAAGYNHYHCYTYAFVFQMESILFFDKVYGMESAAVIYATPGRFTEAGCKGQTTGSSTTKDMCPPAVAYEPDFQDYITFLTYGRNGRWSYTNSTDYGRITHYIIGNEVDSPQWFDPTPFVNTSSNINSSDALTWVTKYARLLSLAHSAVALNQYNQPAMLYVPIDRVWTVPTCPSSYWQSGCSLGAQQLLTLLWQIVGTSFDWSVAVHAYGIPLSSDWSLTVPYGAYTFLDLPKVVAFQQNMLLANGSTNPTTAPQTMLAATEQNWASNPNNNVVAAAHVCAAHQIAVNSANIMWVSHLDFQEVTPGYFQGFVQPVAGDFLNNASMWSDVGLLAFQATDVTRWNVDPTNFCCVNMGLGCPAGSGWSLAATPPPAAPAAPPAAAAVKAPVAQCKNVIVPATANCSAMPADVLPLINNQSYDPSNFSTTLSISPQAPLPVGVNAVNLTVSNGYTNSSCSANVTIQDAEPLNLNQTSLCGGGMTTWMIIGQDLPVPFSSSYAKVNGCPVFTNITSARPSCNPATSSTADQKNGISCLSGMVTIPNPNLAIVWQLYSKRYWATWNVSMNATAAYQPVGQVNSTSVTCSVYVQ